MPLNGKLQRVEESNSTNRLSSCGGRRAGRGLTEVSSHFHTTKPKQPFIKTIFGVSPPLFFPLRIQGIYAHTLVSQTKDLVGCCRLWIEVYTFNQSHTNPRPGTRAFPGGGNGDQGQQMKQALMPAPALALPSLGKDVSSFCKQGQSYRPWSTCSESWEKTATVYLSKS